MLRCGFFNESRLEIPFFSNAYSSFPSLRISFNYRRTGSSPATQGIISNDCMNGVASEAGNSLYASCADDSVEVGLRDPLASLTSVSNRNRNRNTNVSLTRLPSKQQLRLLRKRKPLAYRESTCKNLSISCPYEIIFYYVLKHINTTRMHTISRQFIPFIYGTLRKRILPNTQPTLPFH